MSTRKTHNKVNNNETDYRDLYYTYVSYEIPGRLYIGVRKCPHGKTPYTDSYLGSYTDKTFKPVSKAILGVYESKEKALKAEIELHRINDVARNPLFANRACITSTKFSHGMLGKKFTKEHRENLSKSLRDKKYKHTKEAKTRMSELKTGKRNPRYTPRDWHHFSYGVVLQKSCSDMVKMFPDQKLDRGTLSKVSSGKLSHHKGWVILENKGVTRRARRNEKIFLWYHPVHGKFKGFAAELSRRFPEQSLNRRGLSRVSVGHRDSYKGWKILSQEQ